MYMSRNHPNNRYHVVIISFIFSGNEEADKLAKEVAEEEINYNGKSVSDGFSLQFLCDFHFIDSMILKYHRISLCFYEM